MVLLHTPAVQTGWKAPTFSLPDTHGRTVSLTDVAEEKGLVVMFISNHCPYVQAILPKIVRDMRELQPYGIGAVAIASNDIENYPQDAPPQMKCVAEDYGFTFPYLFDEDQSIARAYDAVCTPDFFGFNASLELLYRGRLDDSGMEQKDHSTRDLFNAMVAISNTGKAPSTQYNSMGCSIKWR